MPISEELLKILACPQCKQLVEPSEEGDVIVCRNCRLRFPVRDDIPVMLLDEAERF